MEKDKPGKWDWVQKLRSKSFQIKPDDSKLVRLTRHSGFYLFLVFISLLTITVVTAVTVVL